MTSTIRTSEAAGCSGFSRKLCACGTTTLGTRSSARLRVQPLGAGAAGPVDVGSPVLRRVALRDFGDIDRIGRLDAKQLVSARQLRDRGDFEMNERLEQCERRMLGEIHDGLPGKMPAPAGAQPADPFQVGEIADPPQCRQAKYPRRSA